MLGHSDADLAERRRDDYRQQSVGLHFGYSVAGIEGGPGAPRLRDAAGEASDEFAHVILATGRSANTAGIGLEDAGVALDGRGNIVVDDCQRSSVAHIVAVGDVTGRAMLTPVAIAAARRA